MPREPLFPHRPKKKEPQFPHVPRGQQPVTRLPSPRYEFFSESVRRTLPPLGATGEEKDPIVQVKFFTPWTNWTWYGIEFDGEDTFFGWVVGLEKEFGSFSLSELQSVRGPVGLKIERDIYFEPKPISQVMKEHGETLAMTIPKETAYKVFRVSDGKLVFAGNKKDALREFKRLGGTKAGYHFFYTMSETMPEIQSMPATKSKPTRHDVEVASWVERDRIGIWIVDLRTDKTIAEWWDEDAQEMFDQGFFKPAAWIKSQTLWGAEFKESVLGYAESVGLLAGGKLLPQTAKDAYYWTTVNKDTGEIVESFTSYTSSGRALRGGKAYATRHWKSDTALVEVWRQPHRYSENLKIQPVASVSLSLGMR